MLRSFRSTILASCLLALTATRLVQADTLCSIPPVTYGDAKTTYPASAFAIEALESYGVATWYSDREENGDYAETAANLVASCSEDTRLSVVVYGLPNKDCAAGESAVGSTVQTAADYVTFLDTLTATIGSRKVLYILEPDAIGLLAETDGCGQSAGYLANLEVAIELLSANENAEIYLDVGYWTLEYTSTADTVAGIVAQLAAYGSKVKGITLNTSNYQASSNLATLCSNFQAAMGSTDLHCIFDTSRNYNGAPESDEWCNVKTAGIGPVPSSDTGISNVDYFVWVKPPGESDGTCSGRTSDAMTGPAAGVFSDEIFQTHWNQGLLVAELSYDVIDGTIHSSSASASTASSSATQSSASTATDQAQQEDRTYTETPSSETTSSADATSSGTANVTAYADASVASDADPTVQESTASATQTSSETTTTTETPTPTTSPTTTPAPTTATNEISTQSSGGATMGTGVIVMIALVAAAVVALAAILGVRHRQKKMLEEAKTPTDPYPNSTTARYQFGQLTTVRDSNIL
ncbi:hypothetical protein BBJ28_00013703 [Nothophytophthora sp. Chile5]|nr:hypothetical protein BBJ28_00013703 [Nothophytophthora sp. Chile5]